MASGFVRLYSPYVRQTRNFLPLLFLATLFSASYLAGIYLYRRGEAAPRLQTTADCNPTSPTTPPRTPASVTHDDDDDYVVLDFVPHHSADALLPSAAARFPVCASTYSEHTPCEDPKRSLAFPRDRLVYRERHCPPAPERLRCLVPAPRGYRRPLPWPESRDTAWFANVPHEELAMEKAEQNWVHVDGDVFRFPGGGSTFRLGADAYIQRIEEMIPLSDGSIRTAIDTGCGVASWGAYLLSRDIITMSFAPRDTHEAQVQLVLERGVPAMIGIMASNRLPYPSRVFDMAHCSRCLIPWHLYGGQYLMEVDRILRPGGYWLLSGPPVNWQEHWRGWNRTEEDLDAERKAIEAVASKLCWKKLKHDGDIAIWQKPINHLECKTQTSFQFCTSTNPDSAWYTKMETCITPLPEVKEARKMAGGELKKWPERLAAVPPRVLGGSDEGVTTETFSRDVELWQKRVSHYKQVHEELLTKGRYRNILDMNARLGGFAAALVEDPVWVMNVVPTVAPDTLGVVYERGLIGTYHDWCEAMSTYPRTYDLIHSDSVFSLYYDRCPMADILLEMDRILRPEGAVIFRDDVDLLVKVKSIAGGMRWEARFVDHEDGPFVKGKILLAVKKYWTLDD